MVRHGRRLPVLLAIVLLLVFGGVARAYAVNTLESYWVPLKQGSTWSGPSDLPNPAEGDLLPVIARANAVDFADASYGWAVGFYNALSSPPATGALVISTANGGGAWTHTVLTAYPTRELRGVAAVTSSDVWAVGDGGLILRRLQSDASWTEQVSGTTNQLNAVTFASTTTGWAVGAGGTILSTIDGGTTWNPVTGVPAVDYYAVTALDATHVWAVGWGGTVAYNVGGGWTSASASAGILRSVSFADALRGWAVGDGPAFRYTSNGGATWSAQSAFAPPGDPLAAPRSVVFSDALRGVAVGGYETAWRTADGGSTWEAETFASSAPDNGWGTTVMLTGAAYLPGDPKYIWLSGSRDPYGLSNPKAYLVKGELHFPPPPAAPTAVGLALGASPPSVAVSWAHDGTYASRYVVQRSRDGGGFSSVQTVTVGTNAWTDPLTDFATLEKWGSNWSYRVKAIGSGGDSGYTTSSSLKLDTTAPTVSASVVSTYQPSASITILSSDTQSGVAWTDHELDGVAASGTVVTTSEFTSHTLRYRAMDNVGNLGSWSATRTFAVIDNPPAAPTGASAAPGASAPSVQTSWTDAATNETGYRIERSENGGDFTPVQTRPANTTSWRDTLADVPSAARRWGSTWTYRVIATNSGGASAPAVTGGVRIDSTAPTTTASPDSTYTANATFSIIATDTQSGVAWTDHELDGVAASGTVVATSVLGTHTLRHRAMDVAGNLGQWSGAQHFFLRDGTPPLTTAYVNGSVVPTGTVTPWLSTALVVLSSTESGTSYYDLDSTGQHTYGSPFALLGDGSRTLTFWSVGSDGDTELAKVITVQVDSTPPTTTASVSAEYVNSASITIVPSDALSTVRWTDYELDGVPASGTVVATRARTSHTLRHRALDFAGNLSSWSATQSFSVLAPPPGAPTGESVHGASPGPGCGIAWSHDGAETSSFVVERQENGGAWAVAPGAGALSAAARSWTDPLGSIPAADQWGSTWTYRVKAVGPGGSSGWATFTGIRLDVTPPTTSASVLLAPGSASIVIAASDSQSGVAPGSTQYRIDGGTPVFGASAVVTALGSHTIEHRATDAVGNAGTWSAPQSFTVAPAVVPSTTTIATTATSARTGSVPILSGWITPSAAIGRLMVVYVKKPGKRYWTYSSNRVVYNRGGSAAWQYKYTFKRGMAKGVYVFKAVLLAGPGYEGCESPNTVSIRLR